MKPLTTTAPDNNLMLHLSDLRVVQFYRRSLNSAWTSQLRVMDFCATTIQLLVENMVMHNVFSCSTEITESRILFFFKVTDTLDYVAFHQEKVVEKEPGYLERCMIESVVTRPGRTLADYIYMLVQRLLPKNDYARPGKIVLDQCVRANQSGLWTWSGDTFLFSENIDIIISQEQEDQCVDDLNATIRPIIVERNRNPDFRLFSTRLYDEIYEQLNRKQRSVD